MNKYMLFTGAVCMAILGLTIGSNVNPQTAVALGLMWIGLSIKN